MAVNRSDSSDSIQNELESYENDKCDNIFDPTTRFTTRSFYRQGAKYVPNIDLNSELTIQSEHSSCDTNEEKETVVLNLEHSPDPKCHRRKCKKKTPNYINKDDSDPESEFNNKSEDDEDFDPRKQISSSPKKGKKRKVALKDTKTKVPLKTTQRKNKIPLNPTQSSGSQSGIRPESGASQLTSTVCDIPMSNSQHGNSTNTPAIDDAPNSDSEDIAVPAGKKEIVQYTKKARRWSRNPNNWWNNVRKKNRNSGLAYQYKVKGHLEIIRNVAARQVGPACSCKNKCFDKLGMEAINDIFKDYWGLADYDLQTSNLQEKIKKERIKRKRTLATISRKSGTYVYKVFYMRQEYKICKVAFLSIHGISDKRAKFAYEKTTGGGSTIKDRRGLNPNPRKMAEEMVKAVHEHIQSLPVRTSHYTRKKNPNRQFLDCEDKVSISTLYQYYLSWMGINKRGIGVVCESYYTTIFSKCYNIGLKSPRTDICDTCEEFKIKLKKKDDLDENDRVTIQDQWTVHKDKAQVAIKAMNETKDPNKCDPKHWVAICMDLQQLQPCPKLAVGSAFYKSKVNLHNFCIYDLQKEKAYMHVWEENTAKRGSVEIYSCLMKWIEDYVFSRPAPYPRNLKIFADNCGGQNKNNYLVVSLLRLVHKNLFDRIELSYLVPGHSYMACDRAFGRIEQNYKKHQGIYSPRDYCEKIKCSKVHKGIPTPVCHMKREDFLNIEVFCDKENENERLAYIRPTQNKVFQKASQIVIRKSFRQGYLLKGAFNMDDEEAKIIKVHLPQTNEEDYNLSDIQLIPKYPTERKLGPKLCKDLASFKNFIERKEDLQWLTELLERQSHLKDPVKDKKGNTANEDEPEHQQGEQMDINQLSKIWEREKVKKVA